MVRLSIRNKFKTLKRSATIQRPDFFNVTVNPTICRAPECTKVILRIFQLLFVAVVNAKKIYAPAVVFRSMA